MNKLIEFTAFANFTTPEEVARSLFDYFSAPSQILTEEVRTARDGTEERVTVAQSAPIPLIEEWCSLHRISRRSLEALASNHPEIEEALVLAKDQLKVKLIRGGLSEEFNASFAKFVATNETDMVDRSEQINKNLNVNAKDLLDQIEKREKPLRQ